MRQPYRLAARIVGLMFLIAGVASMVYEQNLIAITSVCAGVAMFVLANSMT